MKCANLERVSVHMDNKTQIKVKNHLKKLQSKMTEKQFEKMRERLLKIAERHEMGFGYWEDDGPQRGTLLKNRNNMHPYRQCVEETPPHRNM